MPLLKMTVLPGMHSMWLMGGSIARLGKAKSKHANGTFGTWIGKEQRIFRSAGILRKLVNSLTLQKH
ncbi:hypothetical protein D3C86_1834940 [compost metagenome]